MAAERNFFHRWRGMTTIGYELGVIWEMSGKITDRGNRIRAHGFIFHDIKPFPTAIILRWVLADIIRNINSVIPHFPSELNIRCPEIEIML